MNSRRVARESTGWGMVVAVALLGIALAALVVLTPWRIGTPPAIHDGLSTQHDPVSELRNPKTPATESVVADR